MKFGRILVTSGVLALVSLTSVASATKSENALYKLFVPSNDLRMTRNQVLESSYRDTECIDFSFKDSKDKIGFVCSSRNRNFIREMGITEYDTLSKGSRPTERPESGLFVSTPMAQYEMRSFGSSKNQVNFAVVDCDTAGEANYRATSSCHVAVSSLDAPEVIYSNFVLKYHTAKKHGILQERIKEIWRQLEKR